MKLSTKLLIVTLPLLICSCDSDLSLKSIRQDTTIDIRADLQNENNIQIIKVLPDSNNKDLIEIINANNLEVIYNNGRTVYPVTKNPDNSINFPFTNDLLVQSNGDIKALVTIDSKYSKLINLKTGSFLDLKINPINLSKSEIFKGEKVVLSTTLNNDYTFTWYYSISNNLNFIPISQKGKSIEWTPELPGNYYIKLEILDKSTKIINIYQSSNFLLSVAENNSIIKTTPESGNIIRNLPINLEFILDYSEELYSFNWFYSSDPNLGWQNITSVGKSIIWKPENNGSFFIRVDVINKKDNSVSKFITQKEIVFVSEPQNIFKTDPIVANINRGEFVSITADIPTQNKSYSYNWSYSTSLQLPFEKLNNIIDNNLRKTLKWRPDKEGSYYIKVDALDLETKEVLSFTSKNPIVFVNETIPLFITNPITARIFKDSQVEITVNLKNSGGATYVWYYSNSEAGPWTSFSGTTSNTVTWKDKNKIPGSYYIRVDLTDIETKVPVSFVSKNAIIFVEDPKNINSGSFGFSEN